MICRIALALGKSLTEVMELPAAELAIWSEWYVEGGFPTDRGEWVVAASGAYVGGVWGGKARASDLIPRTGGRQTTKADVEGVRAWFAARAKKDG